MSLRTKFGLGLASAACLLTTACMNESEPATGGPSAPYLVITTNEKGNGYAATFPSLPSGDLDIASSPNAIQVQTGWGSGAQFQGKDFFIIASYTGVSGIHKYSVTENGRIEDGGVLSGAQHFTLASAEKGFYFDPALGKMKIQTFNPKTMERTGEIDCANLTKGDKYEVVGDQLLTVRDGKLFTNLVFSDTLNGGFSISKYDTGFVAVIDIATGKVEKTIKAPGVIFGFGYPADMDWDFTDVNGDLYLVSPFELPWSSPGDRSGQIWRIKAGSTDFDGWKLDSKDYGEHLSIMSGHVRDGKIYTQWWSEPVDAKWSNFVTDVLQGVSIDVSTKKLTVLADSPKFRFNANTPVHEVDGKLYYSVLNADFNGVYVMDGGKLKSQFAAKTGGSVLHFHKIE